VNLGPGTLQVAPNSALSETFS